jgi:hypothetical protein
MTELKWIEDLVVPETSDDAIELLTIIDEFSKFPNNFINAKCKRMGILGSQMTRIIEIEYTNTMVADVASQWLSRLENLMYVGDAYGRDKWYQKNIRKIIRKMKRDIETYPEKITNSDNYWFSCTAEEMMEPWKKMIKD